LPKQQFKRSLHALVSQTKEGKCSNALLASQASLRSLRRLGCALEKKEAAR
jgi:hypothetical protein